MQADQPAVPDGQRFSAGPHQCQLRRAAVQIRTTGSACGCSGAVVLCGTVVSRGHGYPYSRGLALRHFRIGNEHACAALWSRTVLILPVTFILLDRHLTPACFCFEYIYRKAVFLPFRSWSCTCTVHIVVLVSGNFYLGPICFVFSRYLALSNDTWNVIREFYRWCCTQNHQAESSHPPFARSTKAK